MASCSYQQAGGQRQGEALRYNIFLYIHIYIYLFSVVSLHVCRHIYMHVPTTLAALQPCASMFATVLVLYAGVSSQSGYVLRLHEQH